MLKTVLIIVAVSDAIGKIIHAESVVESENFAVPDELDNSMDANSRAASSDNALGAAAVPSGTTLSQGDRPFQHHQCFVCTDCPSVLLNTTYKTCPYSADSSKNNKCVVYSEKYRHMKKPWYIRGCASERGSCLDIIRAHSSQVIVKLNLCRECDGDKCNVNGGSRPETLAAFFVLVVTPLLSKHILS